jgi:predicted phosphodiesterase
MRYLVLSDIHSNDEALAAVLARARRRGFDRAVILGDFVGYGAEPNAVLDRLRRLRKPKTIIRGNHDKVVCGLDDGQLFNPVALEAARWTAGSLTEKNRAFLEALPPGPLAVDGAFEICHGSPRDEDAYIFSDRDALVNFRGFGSRVCFFGHSHIPSIFTLEPRGIRVEVVCADRSARRLEDGHRYLINPGSVGQPRDGNPAASFAVFDETERVVSFERVPYDVERTRQKIYRAGLPAMLGDRLLVGA